MREGVSTSAALSSVEFLIVCFSGEGCLGVAIGGGSSGCSNDTLDPLCTLGLFPSFFDLTSPPGGAEVNDLLGYRCLSFIFELSGFVPLFLPRLDLGLL